MTLHDVSLPCYPLYASIFLAFSLSHFRFHFVLLSFFLRLSVFLCFGVYIAILLESSCSPSHP